VRKFDLTVASVAVASLIVTLGVGGSASAETAPDPEETVQVTPSPTPEATDEAAEKEPVTPTEPAPEPEPSKPTESPEPSAPAEPDGEKTEEAFPSEPWAPAEGTRLDPAPDANARGVAPLGAPVGTVAGKPGLGELPWFGFEDFELWEHSTLHVNLGNGNLLVKANDSKIAVPGYGLRQDRYYNGLSTSPGTLGGGWQHNNGANDIGVVDGGSYVDYFAFNGAKFRFTASGSSYTAPSGSNLTLTKDAGSTTARYVVTVNKTGEQLKFSTSGWLTSTVDRNGVGETYAYSSSRISSVTHANGRKYTFTYDSGRLEEINDNAGREIVYEYDSSNRLNDVEDAENVTTTYEYDSTGRLSKITVPFAETVGTITTTIQYDTSHRVKKIIQEKAKIGTIITTVETVFTYNSGQTIVTDPNGNNATYTIDSEGRVSATKDALNRTRSQTWTANSDVATTTDGIGTNVTTYTYDGSNNQTNAQLPTGAAASAAYAVGTGCSAPNTGTAFQPKCSTDPAGNSSQYQYDASGNLTKQTNTTGGGSSTEFEKTYDNSSRSVCGGFAGQVCTTKDANGKTTSYAYNTAGDLTTVTPPAPLGATTYTYDSVGRVASVTDGAGNTTVYAYDNRDRTTSISPEGSGEIAIEYWDNGLEKRRFDWESNAEILYDYDRLGRLTQQQYTATSVTQQYTYDNVGNILTYQDGAGTTTYTYDVANQLKTLKEPGGTCPSSGNPAASSGCVLFEYDNNGNETKRIYPGGAVTETARDNSGRATRITAKDAAGNAAVDIGYSFTFPGTSIDQTNVQSRTSYKEQGITAGAVSSYSYDSRNRLTKAEEKSGATVTASWTYGYDAAGNRTSQIRAGSTGAPAGTINYTYNDANQITSATGQTATWTYDGAGNQTRNGLTGQTAVYNDRLQATSIGGTNQGYIGTGNNDRLSAASVTFQNGALGTMQRTNGTTTHSYTRAPDGSAIGYRAAARQYYITDHLGSVVGIFSPAGTWAGGYSYSPYGEARFTSASTIATVNNLRYIGQHHDGNGIYKLGARYYDTSLGRFTQMDPSGQESNPYAYAQCNPTNASDPSGLLSQQGKRNFACVMDVVGVIGGILGAVSSIGILVGKASTGVGLLFGAYWAISAVNGIYQAALSFGDARRSCKKFRW
jgi:RHS repeat-associated protein